MLFLKKLFPLSARISRISNIRSICITPHLRGIYEPDYLDSLKPKYPLYPTLDVRMTGYDYPILESYQKFVHRIAESLDLDVSDCWAAPPKKTHVLRYKPASSAVESEYKLTTYERYVQIADMQAPIYPLFLRFIQEALPEGVTLNIVQHTDDIDEKRYVPDKDLLDLKKELDSLGGPSAPTKKR